MGELSKFVGEKGELIAKNLLSLLGWDQLQGFDIKCSRSEKHKLPNSKGNRETHGVDYVVSYKCPLVDDLLKIVVISVKATSNSYPSAPRKDFLEHWKELSQTIECFKNDERLANIKKEFSGVNKTEVVGMLVWLATKDNSYNDIKNRLSNIQIGDEETDLCQLFVLDNEKALFLIETLHPLYEKYGKDNVLFHYTSTGKNQRPEEKRNFGNIAPIELVVSDILPIKLINQDKVSLYLECQTNFNKDSLKRIIGLGNDIARGWASQTVINFPDYNSVEHNQDTQEAKLLFEDKSMINNLIVGSYKPRIANF